VNLETAPDKLSDRTNLGSRQEAGPHVDTEYVSDIKFGASDGDRTFDNEIGGLEEIAGSFDSLFENVSLKTRRAAGTRNG
jgi:hypothetical protein